MIKKSFPLTFKPNYVDCFYFNQFQSSPETVQMINHFPRKLINLRSANDIVQNFGQYFFSLIHQKIIHKKQKTSLHRIHSLQPWFQFGSQND